MGDGHLVRRSPCRNQLLHTALLALADQSLSFAQKPGANVRFPSTAADFRTMQDGPQSTLSSLASIDGNIGPCPVPATAPNWLGRFGQKENGHSL